MTHIKLVDVALLVLNDTVMLKNFHHPLLHGIEPVSSDRQLENTGVEMPLNLSFL